MSNELATRTGGLGVSGLKERKATLGAAMSSVLQEGMHYGKIPYAGDKPTLLQPGAQALCNLFGFAPKFETKIEHLQAGHREYMSTCTLIAASTGVVVGSGMGSCSTMESKYRYRKNKGQRIENPDIADVYNTCLKMANKRALVAAVLNTTGASDLFTQDIEDFSADTFQQQAPKPKTYKHNYKELTRMKKELMDRGEQSEDTINKAFLEYANGKKLQEMTPDEFKGYMEQVTDFYKAMIKEIDDEVEVVEYSDGDINF